MKDLTGIDCENERDGTVLGSCTVAGCAISNTVDLQVLLSVDIHRWIKC